MPAAADVSFRVALRAACATALRSFWTQWMPASAAVRAAFGRSWWLELESSWDRPSLMSVLPLLTALNACDVPDRKAPGGAQEIRATRRTGSNAGKISGVAGVAVGKPKDFLAAGTKH